LPNATIIGQYIKLAVNAYTIFSSMVKFIALEINI